MEGTTSFNPGFLGSSFNWWIGQIADDSVWRDNILSGKYANPGQIPGWGRRYKVRIMGLHDQGEETIPSEDLPWAQIMYPVTAGGGQTEAYQTPALRQGNMVFGFFMDGPEMQVPVIMGILGNNSQTVLAPTIGDTKVTDTAPGSLATSGIARGQVAKLESQREVLPDESLQTTKPGISPYTLPPPPGTALNEYGLSADASANPIVRQYISAAENEASERGLQGEEIVNFIKTKVKESLDKQRQRESSPLSPADVGATKEHVDGIHQLDVSDIKRDDRYKYKIPMMKADDSVGSAVKAIQTVADNLINMIDKYLQSFQSYVEKASSVVRNIRKEIENAANSMSKYMKVIYDKIAEYITKIINQGLSQIVSSIPSSFRHLFADVKEKMTGLTYCLYNQIIKKLSDQILKKLTSAINLDELEKKAKSQVLRGNEYNTAPKVPMCYAEDIVASTIGSTVNDVNLANKQLLDNLESFAGEIESQISSVTNEISGITSQITEIIGTVSGAMNFTNVKLNVFGCDLTPNMAVSDFFTLDGGGGGQPHTQLPSAESINRGVNDGADVGPTSTDKKPYALPPKEQASVVYNPQPETIVQPTS